MSAGSQFPKALQIASNAHLGYRVGWQREAAAELRRLQAVNDELLEALRLLVDRNFTYLDNKVDGGQIDYGDVQAARAAIAKATGGQP